MTAVHPPAQPGLDDERLVGVLIPPTLARRPASVAPLPMLPAPVLPSGAGPADLLLGVARVDGSGRVSARPLLGALGWPCGRRLGIAVVHGALVIGAAASGLHVVNGRGEVALPAAGRRMCGIDTGAVVVLAACPARSVLVVHPAEVVAGLLVDWYARLAEGDDDGRRP
jgi:hypothetical protein